MTGTKTPLASKSFDKIRRENLDLIDKGIELLRYLWDAPTREESIQLIRKALDVGYSMGHITELERQHRTWLLAKELQK